MVEPVSLVLGIPGLLDACLSLTTFMIRKIDAVRTADNALTTVLTSLKAHSTLCSHKFSAVQTLQQNAALSATLEAALTDILSQLRSHLQRANELLEHYTPPQPTPSEGGMEDIKKLKLRNRLGLGFTGLSKLRALVDDLAKWEAIFSSHVLVLMIETNFTGPHEPGLPHLLPKEAAEPSDPSGEPSGDPSGQGGANIVSNSKSSSTNPPTDDASWPLFTPTSPYPFGPSLSHSPVYTTPRSLSILLEIRTAPVLSDGHTYPIPLTSCDTRTLRSLTHLLSAASPLEMHILPCISVFRTTHDNRYPPLATDFALTFRLPDNYGAVERPRSLRNLLLDKIAVEPAHPLDHRVRLAVDLAKAVLYLQTGAFVHKNISPENILVCSSDAAALQEAMFPAALGRGFLVGFSVARRVEDGTSWVGDKNTVRNLYRHRKRWGEWPEERFNMLHDVYSLGVVLLELGLWTPLIKFARNGGPIFNEYIAKDVQDSAAGKVQLKLVKMAKGELRARMGSAYSEVVVRCLECVEKGLEERETGVEAEGRRSTEDTTVEASFLTNVLGRLQDIRLVR